LQIERYPIDDHPIAYGDLASIGRPGHSRSQSGQLPDDKLQSRHAQYGGISHDDVSHLHAVPVSLDDEQETASCQQLLRACFRIETQSHTIVVAYDGYVRPLQHTPNLGICRFLAAHFPVWKHKGHLVAFSLNVHDCNMD
jgi:hypothetical protein